MEEIGEILRSTGDFLPRENDTARWDYHGLSFSEQILQTSIKGSLLLAVGARSSRRSDYTWVVKAPGRCHHGMVLMVLIAGRAMSNGGFPKQVSPRKV